ncbi:phosphodiesterase, family protein [Clostridium argentinense CDC 2741]|uniref:Phosphoesterase n=1 Tax=Clostridium argentinense CDC 2741 TaxID=1418104 RepID=A0A0C1RDT7_9CLOT|nr:phosphodiesterase [Clostridium argentinense]ARC84883.1 phosphodiesterase [Clostridium argentinense]KIE48486.1 phosphodiesterase, family protein [Clostridium argentinense CDC 2741]NFF40740.1 phosphodiesterase [Clostridium argentinense]NFP51913.1 phosphodiesterase [Clostridium argentinense]NFP74385.1 phosphodiesterase [Clostridium argentinense]
MKLFFMSDIHGSLKYAKLGVEAFIKEEADYMVILGDVLYHGPRNPLPEEYNPKEVANLLNEYAEKIIGVRGNCDAEVDQMLLTYPCMMDYNVILTRNRRIFVTHGHIYNENNLPNISKGDIIIYGHTHIPVAESENGIFIFNPGSIAYPKENNPHSYGVIDGNKFYIKNLEGEVIKEIDILAN